MRALSNRKAVSTLIIVLLLLISAIIGGLVSYMFTISQFFRIPEGTALTIMGVYFDKGNAKAFKVGVLNPSYSPANATITRIAVSLKGESQLYDIVETEPSIQNGTVLRSGESINITCSKLRRDEVDVTWGRFAGEFANRTIVVHVFSSDSSAANREEKLPFVKLYVSSVDFNPRVSFKNFSITLVMDESSEINLTVNEILVPGIDDIEMKSPGVPFKITKDPVRFDFTGNWHGLKKTNVVISTDEGYSFTKELELQQVYPQIQNVTFNEDYTDHFNVTIFNFAETDNYVNVTRITCTPENGIAIVNNYTSVGLIANQSLVFKFDWDWKEHRRKEVAVKAYFLQDFETETTVTTPPPIIVNVLKEKETFNLTDKTYFNITLQNHPSSLDAINITKIVVKEANKEINVTDQQLLYGPIKPNQNQTFCCNFNWTEYAGENLTLTVYALTNETLENYTFDFTFALPAAELNITSVTQTEISGTKYLNITIKNMDYSVWNLTISKVKITLQNQSVLSEQTFSEDQMIINPNSEAVLLYVYDWITYPPENITITVITAEGVEASWQGTVP